MNLIYSSDDESINMSNVYVVGRWEAGGGSDGDVMEEQRKKRRREVGEVMQQILTIIGTDGPCLWWC